MSAPAVPVIRGGLDRWLGIRRPRALKRMPRPPAVFRIGVLPKGLTLVSIARPDSKSRAAGES